METPLNIDPDLASAVLAYFRSHPRAVDSVEGVARWRLLEATVPHEIDATGRALRWLADSGYLIEESAPGVSPLYRLSSTDPEQRPGSETAPSPTQGRR